jgi:zinc-ribbon family
MFFFFIIGTHYFTWGSDATPPQMRCSRCGSVARFRVKKGMRFLTLFFIIPVIPLSGVNQLYECPNCKARYQA